MSYYDRYKDISVLNGREVESVDGLRKGSELVTFNMKDGSRYEMQHHQDCCENVDLEEVSGDPSDLQDCTILRAEQVSGDEGKVGEYDDEYEWTFYNIQTSKGFMQLRWYGTSNGYYSMGVDFTEECGPREVEQ